MGGSNYAQFGDGVHVGGADVRAETDHAGGENNHFVGRDGLEGRDELGGVADGEDPATRAKTERRGAGEGEAAYNARKEQRSVRLYTPTKAEEDRGG